MTDEQKTGDKKYVVKSEGAIVNVEDGLSTLLPRGAAVPRNAKPDHVQHLLDNGLIEEAVVVGGLEPVRTGDLTQLITEPALPEATHRTRTRDRS